MDRRSNAFLETEPLGKLMRSFCVPCVISLLVGALYNIVDQLFIANASYLGSYGNAANTVVFPMTVVALAVAVTIGDGCCTLVSISLGAGEKQRAAKSVWSAVFLSVIVGIIICACYFIFMEPLLTAFGGHVNEGTYTNAREYFFYIDLGMPFYIFGQAMNPVIRSDGSPKFAMISTLAGAVFNIIFDPIFIFVFRWGMMGAALATILGQIITAALAVWYLFHMKAVKLERRDAGLHPGLARKYVGMGMPSFFAQFSLVLAMLAIQNMVVKYGGMDPVFGQEQFAQIPMAVLGIVMKFFQIVISISVGLAAGCIPVAGYNIGAGAYQRAKKLFKMVIAAEAVLGIAALLIVEIFPRQLIDMFGAANESQYYTDFAIRSFRTYLCMMPLATINKGTFIYLQAMGKALLSTVISTIREVAFGVGFALLLPLFFALDGVLYSMPLSDILTFIIAVIVIIMTFRDLDRRQRLKDQTAA